MRKSTSKTASKEEYCRRNTSCGGWEVGGWVRSVVQQELMHGLFEVGTCCGFDGFFQVCMNLSFLALARGHRRVIFLCLMPLCVQKCAKSLLLKGGPLSVFRVSGCSNSANILSSFGITVFADVEFIQEYLSWTTSTYCPFGRCPESAKSSVQGALGSEDMWSGSRADVGMET